MVLMDRKTTPQPSSPLLSLASIRRQLFASNVSAVTGCTAGVVMSVIVWQPVASTLITSVDAIIIFVVLFIAISQKVDNLNF